MKKFCLLVTVMFLAIAFSSTVGSADGVSVLYSDLHITKIKTTHGWDLVYHTCWTTTHNQGQGSAQAPSGNWLISVYLNHEEEGFSTFVRSKEVYILGPGDYEHFNPTFKHNHVYDMLHFCTVVADDHNLVIETNENNNWAEEPEDEWWYC